MVAQDRRPQELGLFAKGEGSLGSEASAGVPGRSGTFEGPQELGWPASLDASLHPPTPTPRQVWESAGRAAPQKGPPPRRGGSSCRPHAKRGDPGTPGAGADPTANFRSGRRRGRALSSRGSRHRLPTVPSRAALTASSLGASAGGGVRPRSDPSPVAPGPGPPPPGARRALPPGSPAPSPALSSRPRAPTPPACGGAQELPASRRPARLPGRGPWGLGSRPRSARAAYPGWWRYKESDFGFAPPRPRQNLGEPWKREGVRPAPAPFGGRPGGCYTALLFLLSTAFLKIGRAHV